MGNGFDSDGGVVVFLCFMKEFVGFHDRFNLSTVDL